MSDERSNGLGYRVVRHAAVELIALAARERAPTLEDRPLHFVDQGRLADAGVPGDQQDLGATGRDTLKRAHQHRRLAAPPVELLRERQAIFDVALAQFESADPTFVGELLSAELEIVF